MTIDSPFITDNVDIEADPEEIVRAIKTASEGPDITEQEYWYRVRKAADRVVSKSPDKQGPHSYSESKLNEEMRSTIATLDCYTSVVQYHKKEPPEVSCSGGRILRDLAYSYLKEDIKWELNERQKDDRSGYRIDHDQLLDIISEIHNIDTVYLRSYPSKGPDSHLLFIIQSKRGSYENFPGDTAYNIELVSFGNVAFPFAVKEVPDESRIHSSLYMSETELSGCKLKIEESLYLDTISAYLL